MTAGAIAVLVLLPIGFAIFGVMAIKGAVDTGADLSNAPITQAVDAEYRRNRAAAPVIEVDGRRYVCEGGDSISVLGKDVRYDPQDPSNCRFAADVGKRTSDQWFSLGLGIASLVFAAWLGFVGLRRRRVGAR